MNEKIFFDKVRATLFHALSANQVAGMKSILDAWDKLDPKSDHRFKAYALATAYHETAQTMQPIEEYGHGRGRAYGAPAGRWHLVYDGRGDVQLTWLANYQKATDKLHAAKLLDPALDLVKDPSLALRPDVAAAVMVLGMRDGWFTGKRLGEFFTASESYPVQARRIINGLDCAAKIAGYFTSFDAALRAAEVTPAVV